MLHLNDNRFGFPRVFLEKTRELIEMSALYPDEWRTELQNVLARHLNVSRSNILVTNGITESLEMLARYNRGKIVGTLYPSHPPFQKMLTLHEVITINQNLLKNGELTLHELQFPTDRKPTTVFIDTPNDPIGMDIPKSLIEEFLNTYQGLVVIDEAGWGFSEQDCTDLAKKHENVVILRTFSKVFGLAGLQVGYVLGNPDVLETVLLRYRTRKGASPLAQQLAILAMESKVNEYLKTKVAEVRTRFQTLLEEIEINYFPSTTNYLLIEIPSRKALDEIEQELSRHRVFVQPFYNLNDKCYLRVTLAPLEALEYVVEAIEVYRYD